MSMTWLLHVHENVATCRGSPCTHPSVASAVYLIAANTVLPFGGYRDQPLVANVHHSKSQKCFLDRSSTKISFTSWYIHVHCSNKQDILIMQYIRQKESSVYGHSFQNRYSHSTFGVHRQRVNSNSWAHSIDSNNMSSRVSAPDS